MEVARSQGPGFTRFGRAIGRCRTCRTVNVWESATDTFAPRTVKCECGTTVKVNQVFGSESGKACDARCTGATGHDCECSCGGENHGADHTA